MNRAKWDSLPDDLKKILEKHGSSLATESARIREAQEAISKKKVQTDPRFTSLAFSDQQRAELQAVTAPAVVEWKANMAKLGIDGDKLYARARELILQYKVAAK
jgi:TRAP-type C4-dicarboxylate transport system substrate-binding protein